MADRWKDPNAAGTLALARTLRRHFPYMDHLWEAVECPFCHAPSGEPCKTKRGQRADMSHMSRIDDFNAACRA